MGRKYVNRELRKLIFRMVSENGTWGAPRVHGELKMLGFDISERTVLRWMRKAPRDPEPANQWKVFLSNHREAIAAMDFFTVPTLTFEMLYCFFVTRMSTLGFGAMAVVLALHAPSIIDGLLICYSIWAPTLLPALLWALLGLPTSRLAGLGAVLGGGITSTSVFTLKLGGGSAAVGILYGLGGSLLGASLGWLWTTLRRNR
jgi:hypothetical protein